MADPIIQIVIKDDGSAGAGPAGGAAAPRERPGEAPPLARRGGGGDEDDFSERVGRSIRTMIGRRIPGGGRVLDAAGVGDAIDEVAKRLAPALKSVRDSLGDFVRDLLGLGPKPGDAGRRQGGDSQEEVSRVLRDRAEPKQEPRPDAGQPGQKAPPPGGQGDVSDVLRKRASPQQEPPPGGGAKQPPAPPKAPAGGAPPTPPSGGGGGGAAAEGGAAEAGGAEAAGASGAGLAGMAAVAGPVAVALLAVAALDAAADKAIEGIRGIGRVGADIARNDPGPAIRRFAGGIVEAADVIPVLGKIPKAFLAVSDAADELKQAFLQRARDLAPYSGAITAAQGMADVRKILGDLREAQALGPKLAQVVTIQSKIDVELQRALEPIKQDLLDVLIPTLEVLRGLVPVVGASYQVGKSAVATLDEVASNVIPGYQLAKGWFAEWVQANRKHDADVGKDDPFNPFIRAALGIDPNAMGAPPPGPLPGLPPGNPFGGVPG